MPSIEKVFFQEPIHPDPTYASRTEGRLKWLSRSTHPLAVDMRRFLNFNLNCLDKNFANEIHGRLLADGQHWRSAFFEMVVARTLQSLDGALTYAPQAGNSHPDFGVCIGGQNLVVEATAPIFRKDIQDEMGQQEYLKKILEPEVPAGWTVLIQTLPDLGPQDSKKEFKEAVKRIFEGVGPPSELGEEKDLRTAVGDGWLELALLSVEAKNVRIAGGPGVSWVGDGVERIRKTVKKKRCQVRDVDCPVLLAVNVSEVFSGFEDFDRALLGHQHSVYDVEADCIAEERFVADGVFDPAGDEEPTIAGVLAYVEAGFLCAFEPVLYVHPRHRASFPQSFERLERRSYDPMAGIVRTSAHGAPVLASLKPVQRSSL